VLCVVSTAGLPVALSILISSARAFDDDAKIVKIYKVAVRIFFVLGTVGTVIMLGFAKPLSRLIGNDDAFYCILAIAPALFFICLSSAIRGYCQGFEDMKPTAISQLIEAIAKLALGILFATLGIKKGFSVPIISALAVLGITVGTALSLLYLFFARKKHAVRLVSDNKGKAQGFYKELLRIALPITIGSAVISLTRIIDMALIMRRLQDIGVSQFKANEIYGAYTTLALPVFSLIPSLITPISMALIPLIIFAVALLLAILIVFFVTRCNCRCNT
jgi:stage V sporulation protein B